MLVCVALIGLTRLEERGFSQDADMAEAIDHAKSLSLAFRKAAEATTPSVVTLVASKSAERQRDELRRLLDDPRFRGLLPDNFDPDQIPDRPGSPLIPGLQTQVGSGVVIDSSGIILTNNHVVESADEVIVRFADGREVTATEVKTDPLSDLAIVRLPAQRSIKAAQLGDSSKLKIGDWVIAIGSPFELEATVSAGIISGQGRGIEKIRRGRLLQTDAAINPGNSGGPLVNLDGEVVGINTAIASNSGGYQGIGFAIPVNRAKWIASELLTRGSVRRAYLGIQIDELTAEAAKKLELEPRSGVYVVDVLPDSAADEAGLKTNDVITIFAGERVRGPRDLQDVVEQKPINSQQTLTAVRRGTEVKMTVTLRPLPD
jgi:serine protease Do